MVDNVLGCGDPELPASSVAGHTTDFQMEVSCAEGYALTLDNGLINNTKQVVT